MSRRKRLGPEEIAEECCFKCKASGEDLRVCNFKNCLKAYHPRCVENEDGFLRPDEQFICDWHRCKNCKGSSHYQCLCCPIYSVCHDCLSKVEFVILRMGRKGFCSNCLNLAILIEKNADADPYGGKTDYRNAEIYKILFRDYWEGIKYREHLTLIDLEEASVFLSRRLNYEVAVKSKIPDKDNKSDDNILADNDVNEEKVPFDSRGKQNKVKTLLKNNRSNKKTYIGWCSEELTKFLSSYGKDTSEPLDEVQLVGAIKDCIKQKNLFHDSKKKTFLCDDKLQPLFRRRKVRCKMIRKFLAVHLAANAISEDESFQFEERREDESSDGSEGHDVPVIKKKPRNSLKLKVPERIQERNKTCFASLNQSNLKLIYLKRSLVIDLLSDPDMLEQKVVGCVVRINNVPKVHSFQMSKNPYRLGIVTAGIKKSSEEYKIKDTCTNIILCVTGLWDDINISMLSDEDFEEDECNDLTPLVEKGLLRRVTVAEMKEKVATVQKDIVNHWIDKELERVEKQIERAHEKGWRNEMEELFDKRRLLRTPAERQRRLEEVPEIVADNEEIEPALNVAASNSSQVNGGTTHLVASSFKDLEVVPPKGSRDQVTDSLNLPNEELTKGATQQVVDSLNVSKEEQPKGATEQIPDSLDLLNNKSSKVASKHGDASSEVCFKAGEAHSSDTNSDPALHSQMHNTQDGSTTQAIGIDKHESNHSRQVVNTKVPEVIILDSDEDGDLHTVQHAPEGKVSHAPKVMNGGYLNMERPGTSMPAALLAHGAMNEVLQRGLAHTSMNGKLHPEQRVPWNAALWHYVDPQGDSRGPFPLILLFDWKQNGYFEDDFRVWRTGQTVEQAILLQDVFRINL